VVDVAEQVRNTIDRAGGVVFIHVEIYRDNDVAKGFRPQVTAYRLPTEPWTFVIDRHGIVRDRFEGALSVRELTQAVERVMH
jgi:transposase-like protein